MKYDTDINMLFNNIFSSYRVCNDVFFLISDDYSTVTSSNGFYLNKHHNHCGAFSKTCLLLSHQSPLGPDLVHLMLTVRFCWKREHGAEYDDGSYLVFDHDPTGYRISVINETASSDGAVYVEEVTSSQEYNHETQEQVH